MLCFAFDHYTGVDHGFSPTNTHCTNSSNCERSVTIRSYIFDSQLLWSYFHLQINTAVSI